MVTLSMLQEMTPGKLQLILGGRNGYGHLTASKSCTAESWN